MRENIFVLYLMSPSQWNDLGVWVSKQRYNYEKPYTETNPSL